jgi:hypothetical protein
MDRTCVECGARLEADRETAGKGTVTGGLCAVCTHHLMAQKGMPLMEFLDGLGAPIVLVDGDGVVRAASARVCELLGKELSSVNGERGGDVFECAYAAMPEGCGRTIHCSGCTVRNTVMETLRTGVSAERVPASLRQGRPGRARDIELLISTERAGDHVLLRIDMLDGRKLL